MLCKSLEQKNKSCQSDSGKSGTEIYNKKNKKSDLLIHVILYQYDLQKGKYWEGRKK